MQRAYKQHRMMLDSSHRLLHQGQLVANREKGRKGQIRIESHLGKTRLQQPVRGFTHQLPLLNSPAALSAPAVECPVERRLAETADCLCYLALLLYCVVQVTLPGVKRLALGAVCEVRQGTLRFAVFVLGQLDSFSPAGPGY